MNLTLRVWRQRGPKEPGALVTYRLPDVSHHMSFLEMLDTLNQHLVEKGEEPVAFEHDCREGICGCCGVVIDGVAHGPRKGTTACQLHMRFYDDGDTIVIEPWRAAAFPVLRDLIVDRSAFDRIVEAGGFISVRTGSAPEANATLIPKDTLERSMDAAECIGCGACVAACPNASATLFISAKVAHLGLLPQGRPEAAERVRRMFEQAGKEGFGYCSNYRECEAVCPKRISVNFIAFANREFHRGALTRVEGTGGKAG
ncbi:MAG: succinate dehydrogenase/fumarate reductase iron-sulfur subunit [Deltaproteobacteria bacterium]|nr:succinate dehydrogenase/fumarate reductase iron-sulfur subunit [Deltaproteobacteria bacterium]